MPGSAVRGAETRERLIHAAWEVIVERGLSALTTRLVAKAAGISPGMCNYHFRRKDDLVLAVVEHARHYWIAPIEALLAGEGTARERLEAVVTWMAEPATRAVMRVHMQLMAQSEWNDQLRDRMAAEYDRWQAAYVRLFEELQGEGHLAPGLDPVRLGIGFATMADGLVWQQSLDASLDTGGVMRSYTTLLLDDGDAHRASPDRASTSSLRRVPAHARRGGA